MIDRFFTQHWRFDVAGREVEVENRWNLIGFTRERLFLDGELVAQNRGWMSTQQDLTARVRGRQGLQTVRARLTSRFWDVQCEFNIDEAEASQLAPPTNDGPWGARPA